MKEKQKPQLDCGVDGINIRFASNYELEQDVYRFTRNKRNKEIEYATLKKIKATNEQIEYALYVNLPKILRNTNIQPYSVLDCTMISFNGNSNSTKRKLGNIILNKNGLDRISATALSRLCAIPAYADFFKPSYKEIIAEAMKSDAQKTYERNSQPVIEEKNRAIGKTYISNFLLRKALSMAVSSDEVTNNE